MKIEPSRVFSLVSLFRRVARLAGAISCVLLVGSSRGQQPAGAPPQGSVIVASGQPMGQSPASADTFPRNPVTNEERTAVVITSDDLDLHINPAEAAEEGRAILTLRNVSTAPLHRIPLQITSTVRWQSIASVSGHDPGPIPFTQSPVTTDADHTGYAQEVILIPEKALAAGATLTISAFFSGHIPIATDRLTLIGTPEAKALESDWDAITPTTDESSTALRGFGDVLWYPVAAPTAVLAEGNQLYQAVAQQRLLNTTSTMRLRLTVVYAGDPPNAAIFNGRMQSLARTPDEDSQVIDNTHGVATTEYPLAPIGFRTPSLFLTAQEPSGGRSTLLSVVTPMPEAAEPYAEAVKSLAPLFNDWIAPAPLTPLLLLEHAGAPFEDHAFIAAHLSGSAQPENIAPEIVRGLTHAFFSAQAPTSLWLDQGLPEYMSLLWTERTSGRDAVVAQLQQNTLALLLAEPDLGAHPELAGTPLIDASSDVYLHLKSAAVLWQLREILGEDLFRLGVANFRHALLLSPALDRDPKALERTLEKTASRSLAWFFDDWVYQDRGLPDLSITAVSPRPILGKTGQPSGFLVAVDVHNDGYAVAEVPVTLRSHDFTATARLRIPGRSTASTRIVFERTPETVEVNDGTVPEQRTSRHTMQVKIGAEQ